MYGMAASCCREAGKMKCQPSQQHFRPQGQGLRHHSQKHTVPASATEAAGTAIDADAPSAAEQAAMDEVAAELVAKLNAAYEQMEPDDVDSGSFPLADADAIEVEPATAAGTALRKGGRKHKPRPKEVPADALPKVRRERHTALPGASHQSARPVRHSEVLQCLPMNFHGVMIVAA